MNSREVNSKSPKRSQRGALSLSAALALGFLLVLPVVALLRLGQSTDLRVVLGVVAAISGVTFFVYWRDKRSAEAGAWRTPESTLHLLEFLGGWPVAFFAQRVFRHKISKPRYQFSFWAIVAAHELVAFDYLRGWSACRELLALVGN